MGERQISIIFDIYRAEGTTTLALFTTKQQHQYLSSRPFKVDNFTDLHHYSCDPSSQKICMVYFPESEKLIFINVHKYEKYHS